MRIVEMKRAAAERAVEQVHSGMVLGLGTGSTAEFAIAAIGEMWREGKLTEIIGVATSERTAEQARSYGLPLATLAEQPRIDLVIDGADEVDPHLDLIKGAGGALLREKQVAQAATTFIVIVDERKLVDRLGTRMALPVEVRPHFWQESQAALAELGCTPVLRGQEHPHQTDNGNYIIDCDFAGGIETPRLLAQRLAALPEVLAHGLFLDMASQVVVAGASGIKVIERS
jgi:ribose 5-phosphate isomerase A